jgi:hypothetical protein
MPPVPPDQIPLAERRILSGDSTPSEAPRRGRPPKDGSPPYKTGPPRPVSIEAFSIPEFCRAHALSRAHYYTLRKVGLGPDEATLLGRIIITKEAAARWRKLRTTRRPPAALPESPTTGGE